MNLIAQNSTIYIREFQEEDITSQYIAWLNDEDLMQYSNQRFLKHTLATSQQYLQSFKTTKNLFMAICNNDSQLVGTMTAYKSINHRTVDLGILIGREWSGKGFGKVAWETMMNHLSNEEFTRKITAGCVSLNVPMVRLAESSGMKLEGRRIDQEICGDTPADILLFGKIIK